MKLKFSVIAGLRKMRMHLGARNKPFIIYTFHSSAEPVRVFPVGTKRIGKKYV